MEKAGTGIKRVTDSCKDNSNQVRFSFSDSFWVTIYSNDNVTDNREESILRLIKNDKTITTVKLAQLLKVTRRTIARDIESLKNAGKVRRIGSDKSGFWEIVQ